MEDIQGQELLVKNIKRQQLLVGITLGPIVLLVGDTLELEHLLVDTIKEQDLLKVDMVLLN